MEEKKNLFLFLFIALLEPLVLESAQIILCIKKPSGTIDLFLSVPKYWFLLFFHNINTFSTHLLSPLRLTRHRQKKKRACGQHELWSGRTNIWFLNKTRLELALFLGQFCAQVPLSSLTSWTQSLVSLTLDGSEVEKANRNRIVGRKAWLA